MCFNMNRQGLCHKHVETCLLLLSFLLKQFSDSVNAVPSTLTSHLHRSEGKHPYFIPGGGASNIGTWGYIEGFKEMMEQVWGGRE